MSEKIMKSFLCSKVECFLEVLSAILFMALLLFTEFICVYIYYCLIINGNSIIRLLLAAYTVFMIVDRKAENDSSRGQGSEIIRNLKCFKYFANYFPVKLNKTVDLSADKNYLFACYPHGVIGCGHFSNFITNATNFNQLFPGIRSRLVTLRFHFHVPFHRELVLSWGMISPNFQGIKNVLSQSTDVNAPNNLKDGYRSNAVVLTVGGATEALNSRPGQYRIVIKKRKGFIKAVLQTGASLVPVFSFGEVDTFRPVELRYLLKFQLFMKKYTQISPIFFFGRCYLPIVGIPFRKPINTVVGTPIEVIKNVSPTQSDIDKLHQRFMDHLKKLFDEHKWKYIENAQDVQLIME